ncbi:hypothetical protein BH10PLA2_BH10PLA2_32620 [soil metagenome]
MLRRHQWDWLGQQPLSSCLLLIDHADADVMTLGFELLEAHAELNSAPIATWLTRLDGDNFDRLERLSALLEKGLDPARVPLTGLIQLTSHRSLPVARLGLTLLRRLPTLGPDNVSDLLPLAQAECASLRIEIATWLRDFLQQHAQSTGDGMLELLDSKFSETRAIGWTWLQDSPQHNDPAIWQKLLESPYDDIKLSLIANLSKLAESANQDMICWLWASVLLNLHGGGRYKAGVVKQITARLGKHDSETERLLPLLTIAVRSLRGPEFRTGLRAVVTLFETKPGLREAITKLFPELQIGV